MNEVLKAIRNRRSVRSFTDRMISREDLEKIVEAAGYAPSGMNRQSWHFTVIQDADRIAELAKAVRQALGRDEGYHFYHPNALILTSNDRDNPLGTEDCACAMENIFLAAHSLGIGSVWINQFHGICDQPEVRDLLRRFRVPDSHVVLGAAALGYAADPPQDVPRKTNFADWF